MKSFNYVITDDLGIHARPAGLLVKFAGKYNSKITIQKGEKSADSKRLFALMGLAVKNGDEITVTVDGEDEETSAPEIEKFIQENF